ncbi:hypothetical protein LJB42_001382 [Komagataella kurtzmanii]|nr:hypothetical protein LJB42_001382 [Komagataella kurtzmanii]
MTRAIKPDHYEQGIPVFNPSTDQFEDFYAFNKAVHPYGMQSGIIKVIPPSDWIDSLHDSPDYLTQEDLLNVKLKNPIEQQVSLMNNKSCFSIDNVEKHRTYTLPQWKKLHDQLKYSLPRPRGAKSDTFNSKDGPIPKEKEGEFTAKIDTSIYEPDYIEFLESQYWKSLKFSAPLYAADSLGSLFPKNLKTWNVSSLPNLLDYLPEKIPGVNDSYLYAGLWKATFSWHLEDQDLHSINYIHFGAPKKWYSIPQDQHREFYQLMSNTYPDDAKHCPEFLRHKTFLVDPKYIRSNGITVNEIVHREKEFIITYPYGYHSGFNLGYNLAESVNFAIEEWLPIGLRAKKCECIDDSVGIDVRKLMESVSKCILCPTLMQKNIFQESFDKLFILGTNSKAHRICGKLIPGLEVDGDLITKYFSMIDNTKLSICNYCGEGGYCVSCSFQDCTNCYHVLCSLNSNVSIDRCKIYCELHKAEAVTTFDSLEIGDIISFDSKYGEIVSLDKEKETTTMATFPEAQHKLIHRYQFDSIKAPSRKRERDNNDSELAF